MSDQVNMRERRPAPKLQRMSQPYSAADKPANSLILPATGRYALGLTLAGAAIIATFWLAVFGCAGVFPY